MEPTKDTFDARAAALDELLGTGRSFDMVTRPLTIAGRRARLWVVNGYAEDALLERAISAWRPIGSLADTPDLQAFLERYVSVCDAAVERDRLTAVTAVFAGKTLLIIDGYEGGLLMDAKQFPLRSVEEPNSSKAPRSCAAASATRRSRSSGCRSAGAPARTWPCATCAGRRTRRSSPSCAKSSRTWTSAPSP